MMVMVEMVVLPRIYYRQLTKANRSMTRVV